jgi:hypothetical protein
MTPKQFQRFLDRDKRCLHCGADTGLIPQHRINRGMGGSKLRNRPSNIIVLCAIYNGVIESDAREAERAKRAGWKLESWQDPLEVPVLDWSAGIIYRLDDDFGRAIADKVI